MAVVTNGLKYYWNAKDGVKTGNVLNNLAPDGASSSASLLGGAIYNSANEAVFLDGNNDYISIANNAVFNNSPSFTYEYIYQPITVYRSGYRILIGNGAYMDTDWDANGLYFQLMENRSNRIPFTAINTDIDTAQRMHVVIQFNKSTNTVRAWVNGVLRLTTTSNRNLFFSRSLSEPIQFNAGGSSYLNLYFKAFRFYDRVLTSEEVTQNFNNGDGIGLVEPDTTPPATVSNLSGASTTNSVSLSWVNPTDEDFSHVRILRDGVEIAGNVSGTTFFNSGLNQDTTYTYRLIAVDTTGNESAGILIYITTDKIDTIPPVVKIEGLSLPKISDEPDLDSTILTFSFHKDVEEWRINVNGVSWDTGMMIDSGGEVLANTPIQSVIEWTELYQEGRNRINLYGKNLSGYWTPYGAGLYVDGGTFTILSYTDLFDGGNFQGEQEEEDIDGGTF